MPALTVMDPLGRARLRGLVVAVTLVLLPSALPAQERGPEPADKVGIPIEPGIWHLDGTDPTLPLDDLEPLRTIIGSKVTTVGLGESIHTSGGYYEAKHRLFRFLVERMGFRAFAFETPWIAAEPAEPYVQTCEGSPNAASQGFFGVWRSTELSALLRWMCEWNAAHPNPKDRVHVFGFDIQGQARPDVQALQEFLVRVGRDPEAEPWVGMDRCGFVEGVFNFRGDVPEAEAALCDASVQAVEGLFAANARTFGRGARKVHGFGEPALLVDLRFPGTSTPLLEPGRSYELNNTEMVPARAFDLLLYLDSSHKMTPLQWRSCQ